MRMVLFLRLDPKGRLAMLAETGAHFVLFAADSTRFADNPLSSSAILDGPDYPASLARNMRAAD